VKLRLMEKKIYDLRTKEIEQIMSAHLNLYFTRL